MIIPFSIQAITSQIITDLGNFKSSSNLYLAEPSQIFIPKPSSSNPQVTGQGRSGAAMADAGAAACTARLRHLGTGAGGWGR